MLGSHAFEAHVSINVTHSPSSRAKALTESLSLPWTKSCRGRQVSLEYFVLRLAQSRDRHIDIAVTQRGQSQSAQLVRDVMIARGNAFHL